MMVFLRKKHRDIGYQIRRKNDLKEAGDIQRTKDIMRFLHRWNKSFGYPLGRDCGLFRNSLYYCQQDDSESSGNKKVISRSDPIVREPRRGL